MDENGYGSEYAKSDRSVCKLCKSCISAGSLRLAIYVQIPNWYHFGCFFKKAAPSDTCYIRGFDSLRWDDQQKIKEKLGLAEPSSKKKAKSDNKTASTAASNEDQDKDDDDNGDDDENDEESEDSTIDQFYVEYAKSSRSKCRKCDKRIDKDTIRISKKLDRSELWHHLECFAKNKSELGFSKFKPEEIPGFEDLEEDDKKLIKKSIGVIKTEPTDSASATVSKRKVKEVEPSEENEDEDPKIKKVKNEQMEKEQKLKAQSELFWKIRDQLNNELSNDSIKELLELNNQAVVMTGRDDTLNFLCDVMCFGPLKKCPECKYGQLVYKGMGYYCQGNLTEWTKCMHRTQEPERLTHFEISKELKEDYPCLKKFKFKPQARVFAKPLEEKKIKSETDIKSSIKARQPLYKMNFSAVGKLTQKNPQIKLLIERLGGKLIANVSNQTVALISNSNEVEKNTKKIKDAQTQDVHVIDEKFLDDLSNLTPDKIDVEQLILKHNIATWGSDLKTRIEFCVNTNELTETAKNESKYVKAAGDGTGKIKLKVKGGAVVDPDSGLDEEAHILCEVKTNAPYSCVLGLVDIIRGTNSYYKLQIIEHDKKSKWYIFRSWGRVGTTIGGNKLTDYANKDRAIAEFEFLYKDKTGNDWEDRKTAGKNSNKFYPLEMDYGEDEEKDVKSKISDKDYISSSKLDKPIQRLIQLIFDIETMKRQMKEFEIDLNKMPLGKISSNQIKMAFSVLTELTNLIDKKGSQTLILDASNRFYTLIPHDFGMKSPTLLDDQKLIKDKTDMLNNLLDIEIAYSILKTGGGEGENEEDPIDVHYKKLQCEMEVVDKSSEEFKRICEYMENTHAATHSSYKLVVEDVFKISRNGEYSRYEAFKTLHNRKLLWHGSRLTNFVGILSQGLRIAPPEAPCTGYMFGKGVYFADMVSKSANYCFTSKANPTGLMLLCEVALGDMYERTSAEYVTTLPKGKHSTKGCGTTAPNPSGSYTTPDGVEIPMGKGMHSGVRNSSLLYNEYIVYDTAQVSMKYLLRVNFDHAW